MIIFKVNQAISFKKEIKDYLLSVDECYFDAVKYKIGHYFNKFYAFASFFIFLLESVNLRFVYFKYLKIKLINIFLALRLNIILSQTEVK
jgi:hypothetical protein